jgi:hypothetical protein
MSNGARRARAVVRALGKTGRWLLRILWKSIRVVLVAGAAIGPATPPPPPPPKPVATQTDSGGDKLKEQ